MGHSAGGGHSAAALPPGCPGDAAGHLRRGEGSPAAPSSGPGRERGRRGRPGDGRRAERAAAGAEEEVGGKAARQGSPIPSAGRDGERSERVYLLLFLSSPELAAEEEEEQQQEEEEAAPGRQVQQPPRCPRTQRHVPPRPPPASTCGAAAHLRTADWAQALANRTAPLGRGCCREM